MPTLDDLLDAPVANDEAGNEFVPESEADPQNEGSGENDSDAAPADDGDEDDGLPKKKAKSKKPRASKVPKAKKAPPPIWKNRMVGQGEIDPKEVLKHNKNFRDHPRFQHEEMDKALDLIGWIAGVIISARTKKLIDGHLRLERALARKQPKIPYVLVDLDETEEQTALMTFDYIGGLAVVNAQKMDDLAQSVKAQWESKIEELQAEQKVAANGITDGIKDKMDTLLGFTKLPDYVPPPTSALAVTPPDPDSLEDVPAVLQGAFELKEWMEFERGLAFDIPPLRPDMLATCPTPIACWTTPEGSPVCDHYVTVLGNGNVRTLPWERSILLTHTNDMELDKLWADTPAVTKRFLNKRFYAIMTPEFSVSVNFPKAERIWQTFRNRWLGRYWQEAGIKVIPTVSHVGEDWDLNYIYAGIPEGCPCVSTQVQANQEGDRKDDFAFIMQIYRRSYQEILDRIKPKQLIVYGGKFRTRVIDELKLAERVEVISIENFITGRTRYMKQNEAGTARD